MANAAKRPTSHVIPQNKPKHLAQLPVKSYRVAPGTRVGEGFVYVMNKPIGIEEGMVGMSVESEPYRTFIKDQLPLLLKGRHPNIKLQRRFLKKKSASFAALDPEKQIDFILNDNQIKTDKKSGKETYKNLGLSGLMFQAYQHHLGIDGSEKFYIQIGKLTKAGNKVYMVKQDSPMVLGGGGPTISRIMETTSTQKLKNLLLNPAMVAATLGLSAAGFWATLAGRRAFYIAKNRPIASNTDAIVETLSTKVAKIRGMPVQDIEIIRGTYPNGSPKFVTCVAWATGCSDLTGHLYGGQKFYAGNVCVSLHKGHPIKVDDQNTLFRLKEEKEGVKTFEKISPDGRTTEATPEEYEKAWMVSDHNIQGLAESLLSMISLGDRDGIGKNGQNKAILPILDKEGNPTGQYQFFGIDFGKAYKGDNKLISSLQDDFSFDSLDQSPTTCFTNYSILYDNRLRDKMQGVYLLAALRNKFTKAEKEAIAVEYEAAGDKFFADKLRSYPKAIQELLPLREWSDPEATIGEISQEGDIGLIVDEKVRYQQMAYDENLTSQERKHYASYAAELGRIAKIAIETDDRILEIFEKRIHLPPTLIDVLDNIEKLTAQKAYTTSPDLTVRLNHIRVERQDRVPWEFLKNADGSYHLICEKEGVELDMDRLRALLPSHFPEIKQENGLYQFQNLTAQQLNELHQTLTEEKVSQARGLVYRTDQDRLEFDRRMAPKEPIPRDLSHVHPESPSPSYGPSYTQKPSKEGGKAPSPITPQYVSTAVTSHPQATTVLEEPHLTLKAIEAFLSQEANQKKYDVQSFAASQNQLKVQFHSKTSDMPLTTTIKPKAENEEGVYFEIEAQKKNTPQRNETIEKTCRLAVGLAKPGAEFNLTNTPEEDRELVYQSLSKAIAERLQRGEFTSQNAPKIIGYEISQPSTQIHPSSPAG